MRQNDIYRPRPTDVALSGSAGSQRALHIGQLQVVLDAARKDPEVENAVGFLEELGTMCSVARGWLVTAHSDYRAAEPEPRLTAPVGQAPGAAELMAQGAAAVEPAEPPAAAPAPSPSFLQPRGYGAAAPGVS